MSAAPTLLGIACAPDAAGASAETGVPVAPRGVTLLPDRCGLAAGADGVESERTTSWSFVPSGVPTTAIAPTTATPAAVALAAPSPPVSPLIHDSAGPKLKAPSTRRHGVSRPRSSSSRVKRASSSFAISSNERPRQSWSTTMLSRWRASRQSFGAQNLSAVRSSQSTCGSGIPPFPSAARARSNVALTAHSATLRDPNARSSTRTRAPRSARRRVMEPALGDASSRCSSLPPPSYWTLSS